MSNTSGVSQSPSVKTEETLNDPDIGNVKNAYEQLCRELNMDESTLEAAWHAYIAIRHNYTLEGTQLHWLACALYVACHTSALPTVGRANITVEGNGVSLTRLLRSCKLDLPNFFNKAKKWADMSNMKTEFRKKIDRLERNFSVSNVIFKKYKNLFKDVFKDPADDPPKPTRSRKQKRPPCSVSEVFDFCWTLFVRVKAYYPTITDDLVNSYHLLVSCVDYIYSNVVIAERVDLLKKDENIHKTGVTQSEPPCILDWLASRHDGIIGEVRTIREHFLRPLIKKFIDKKLLKGTPDQLSGLLDNLNFEANFKSVRRDYESFVLSIGEFDERVFLDVMAATEIGTPTKPGTDPSSELGESLSARRTLGPHYDQNNLIPSTPLSGQHYLRAREQEKQTPVSQATLLVSRLTRLLGNREPGPSKALAELLKNCQDDPTEGIMSRVNTMGEIFCSNYSTGCASDGNVRPHDTFAKKRLHMGETLYYKLLEAILVSEKSRGKPLDNLLSQDLFHKALLSCCLEIVIFSYNSQRIFPWVLEVFKLEAVHFYKVIEVIIRSEDWLPRDVVKHLQRIEESILESKAWAKESPLWAALERDPLGVPSCEEVSLPNHSHEHPIDITQSPMSNSAFSVVRSPSMSDRLQSQIVSRRQLSFDSSPPRPSASPMKTLQLMSSPMKASTQKIMLAQASPSDADTDGGPEKLRRTGSVMLFFRKVYHLANLRLDLLCHTLEIEEEVKRKIWTVFEYAIIKHTKLMMDRHLDQLLMCSLYIVNKVLGKDINFTEIMKHYRNQPQAASHVYRSVLLYTSVSPGDEDNSAQPQQGSVPPTPTRPAATSTVIDGEERGDIIAFYNKIFMEKLQDFALRFKRSRQNTIPPLSPLPKLRAHPQSPCRQVSSQHPVFIRPLKHLPGDSVVFQPQSPHKPLSYSFSRSPAKDLHAINALMRVEVERKSSVGKRLLEDDNHVQDRPNKIQQLAHSGQKLNSILGVVVGERTAPE